MPYLRVTDPRAYIVGRTKFMFGPTEKNARDQARDEGKKQMNELKTSEEYKDWTNWKVVTRATKDEDAADDKKWAAKGYIWAMEPKAVKKSNAAGEEVGSFTADIAARRADRSGGREF